MFKSDEMKRMEADLAASEELRNKYLEACERIAAAGGIGSDGEMMAKAAEELGYQVKLSELERAFADSQELSDEELEYVAGGINEWCLIDYLCYGAFMHERQPYICTGDAQFSEPCWSDFACISVNN